MKIGDFAKKYGLNITTVRYYVERALLTPERKNNQYVFTPSCMEDMEKILKYKSFRFSLEEIELLFFLEKTTKFRDETVLGIFSRLLKQKQAELEKEEEKNTRYYRRAESRDPQLFSDQLRTGPQRQRHSLYIPALSGMPGLRQTPQTGISQHQRQ